MDGQAPAPRGEPREVGVDGQAAGRECRWILLFGGILFVALLIGLAVGAFVAGSGSDRDSWSLALLFGIPLLVLVVLLLGVFFFARWRRRRGSAMFARSPLYELPSMRQRSKLVKAIRRGDEIPSEQLGLAVRVARDVSRRTGLVWIWSASALLQAVNIVLQDGWLQYLYAANTLIFLGLAGYWAWLIRRMRVRLGQLETRQADA